MSLNPIEWRQLVVSSYGSVAEFKDPSTVESVRELIVKRRADAVIILDAEKKHPGLVPSTDALKIQGEVDQLDSLEAELVLWQENRKAKAAVEA